MFRYSAPATGSLNVTLCPTGVWDSVLYIRNASSGVELGCSDDVLVAFAGDCPNTRGSKIVK